MAWPKGVPNPRKATDEQVIAALQRHGGHRERAAGELGISLPTFYRRIKTIKGRYAVTIPDTRLAPRAAVSHHCAYYKTTITDGTVLIGTDAHIWPGERTTCQRAFTHFVRNYEPRPSLVVLNGDVFDGARISRHPHIGFMENAPSVADELKACKEFTDEIEAVAPASALLAWMLGNHDLRYESYLAANAPEMGEVEGMHLKDHFPRWQPAWTCWVNERTDGWTEIKHRFKGGQHATYANTLRAGVSIVTGHLHALQVYPWTDRRGTRYGVDAGTLADVDGDNLGAQFVHYLEANPVNWRAGFVVLTFKDGRLMLPEMASKWDDNHVEFRGQLIEV